MAVKAEKVVNTEKPILYKGKKGLPVIPPLKSDENHEVLKLLLNAPKKARSLIASTHPVNIENNVNFIVNLDELEDAEDLLSDDLGSWEQTKTRSKWYQVKYLRNGEASTVTKVADRVDGSFQVCRRPYVNKSDKSLRKTIVNVITPDGKNFNLVFVKYYFEGREEHKIEVKPHGNSTKGSIPYLRTYKSTFQKLKDSLAKQSSTHRAVYDAEQAVGGLEFCNSKGALPRGEKQAEYLKSTKKVVDPIFDITQKMKLQAGEDKFIRSYSLDDASPKVVLFTDEQLEDIVNFCCNDVEGHKSLLYVDVTFQLGPFFLMMITYKNTTLYTKRDPSICPLMIGPMMLCMLKDKSTYLTLFQKLTAQVPGLKIHLQGYSTDSECALRDALAQEFQRSVSFLCKKHVMENIKDKCHKLHLSKAVVDVIIDDIFGSGGLVMYDSEAEYEDHLRVLTRKWDHLEVEETDAEKPQFSAYFRQYKSEDIMHHVSAKVSREAGFGYTVHTNNVPESANALLKRWQGFTSTDMSSFVDDVKQLIDKQKSDVQRAFLGLDGPYRVRPEYSGYMKSPSHFFDDSPGKRTIKQKPMVDPASYKQVYAFKHAPPVAQETREDVEVDNVNDTRRVLCFGDEDDVDSLADLDPDDLETLSQTQKSNLQNICSKELGDIFSMKDLESLTAKSEQLADLIRKGFDSDSFLVKSFSSSVPHNIKCYKNGKFACDDTCIGYKTRNICAHVIAVAHHENKLQAFLQLFKKDTNKKKMNLSNVTMINVNKNAGRKRPQRTRRKSSPDAVTSINRSKTDRQAGAATQGTLGDVLYQAQPSTSNPLKVTITRKRPNKPTLTPTTTTPFQLISIRGKIRKCAGCPRELKAGPDDYSSKELDGQLCIRHKEHDFVFIDSTKYWKKTFDNKHYHVFPNCIKVRNPDFDAYSVQLAVNRTLNANEVAFLKERMGV